MKETSFAQAIKDALVQAMIADPRVLIFGEDVHGLRFNLFMRFGEKRVRSTPISESAFLGAAVTAAMAGLRPVVEIMLVDYIGVALDALINHAAKVEAFSGGKWRAPLVIRTACGGGYGDAGQHEQTLWGWFPHIPGLAVVVPATPEDAGRLMLAAIEEPGPVMFMEHKLLADYWLDVMGKGGRETVIFDVPEAGRFGPVPSEWTPLPLGKGVVRREGWDLTMISVGVGVHRALETAEILHQEGIQAGVIDLRSVWPLDIDLVCEAVAKSGRLLVVDEDYERFGLSGELAAIVLEAGINLKFGRVCTQETIPYARHLEDQVLPNVERIRQAAIQLMER